MKIVDGPYTGTVHGRAFELYGVYLEYHQNVLELHSIDPHNPLLHFVRKPNDTEFFARFGPVGRDETYSITLADATATFANYSSALKQECRRLRECAPPTR